MSGERGPWRQPWFWLAVAALIWVAVTTRYQVINPGGGGTPALIRDRWSGNICIVYTNRQKKCGRG